MRHAPRRPRRITGFTLMELLIVIMIIGILLSFILIAAVGAARDAQDRATQALIAKLDSGLGDRLEALLAQRVDPDNTHLGAAYVYATGRDYTAGGFSVTNNRDAFQRAGVLARYDQIKAEIPDVFVVTGGSNYPLNYAMAQGPTTFAAPYQDFNYVLPLGSGVPPVPGPTNAGTGIYGASYAVNAGINKNLGKSINPTSGQQGAGYPPQMYNGVDDDGDGLVDNIGDLKNAGGVDSSVTNALAAHKHVTARAEMLYALLVEGQGPYGSVFNRDDFTDNEVKDTDQDGLPEFVDGWGNPLQFYRWPILYHSDVQRGLQLVPTGSNDTNGNLAYNAAAPYSGPFDAREQDPLDQNQELVMPDWWSSASNQSSPYGSNQGPLSGPAYFFQAYFHLLVDPIAGSKGLGSAPATSQQFWDRSLPASSSVVLYPRRAYYSRFLILSAGPDGQPGVPYLTDTRFNNGTPFVTDSTLKSQGNSAVPYLMIESQAAQATLNRSSDIYQTPVGIVNNPSGDLYTDQLQSDGQDDITNHNLNSSALPVQ